MWSLLSMEYNSGIRSNEALTHDTTWMSLGNMMLSERSQSQEDTWLDSSHVPCPDWQIRGDRKLRGKGRGCTIVKGLLLGGQKYSKIKLWGGFLGGPWVRLCASTAGGPGSIPGWGTRSHMLQLRSPHATTKDPTCHN